MTKLSILRPGLLKVTGMVAALAVGACVMGCGHDHDDRDHAEHYGYYQDRGTYQDNAARDHYHDGGYSHDNSYYHDRGDRD